MGALRQAKPIAEDDRRFKDSSSGETPLVSIVMPLYNSERCLERTITSIGLNETTDYEIILVDDGSSDKTPKICARIAAENPHVRYIRRDNGGISSARNCGMREAQGTWIVFSDHDDLWEPGAFDALRPYLLDSSSQVVKYGHTNLVDGKATYRTAFECDRVDVVTHETYLSRYPYLVSQLKVLYVWDAAWARDFLEESGITFCEEYRSGEEDRKFNVEVFAAFEQASIVPVHLYTHFIDSALSTGTSFSHNRLDAIERNYDFELQTLEGLYGRDAVGEVWDCEVLEYLRAYAGVLTTRRGNNLTPRETRALLGQFMEHVGAKGRKTSIVESSPKQAMRNRLLATGSPTVSLAAWEALGRLRHIKALARGR